eukprot:5942470-Pleurochrysis_carterae.AAC.1
MCLHVVFVQPNLGTSTSRCTHIHHPSPKPPLIVPKPALLQLATLSKPVEVRPACAFAAAARCASAPPSSPSCFASQAARPPR